MKYLPIFLPISLFLLISCTSLPTENVSTSNSYPIVHTNPHKYSRMDDPNADEEQLRQDMLDSRALSMRGYTVP